MYLTNERTLIKLRKRCNGDGSLSLFVVSVQCRKSRFESEPTRVCSVKFSPNRSNKHFAFTFVFSTKSCHCLRTMSEGALTFVVPMLSIGISFPIILFSACVFWKHRNIVYFRKRNVPLVFSCYAFAVVNFYSCNCLILFGFTIFLFLLIAITFNIILMIFLLGRFWYIYANLRRFQSMHWKQHRMQHTLTSRDPVRVSPLYNPYPSAFAFVYIVRTH